MTKKVKVYEYDVASYRVVWLEPNGQYRRSTSVKNLTEAQIRAGRHPWPFAITYEINSVEVVARG